ncbi:MAG: hypothetical protein ACLGHN_04030 [Bacteriovoracia bacterium]
MINKFKDFLKKFSRKRDDDFSDQDEISDEISDDALQDEVLSEDHTGETPLPQEIKPSWKDKLKSIVPAFRKKETEMSEESHLEDSEEEIGNEDVTGETILPVTKPSWKDKFSFLRKKPTPEDQSALIEGSLDEGTGETSLPEYKPSFKERLQQTINKFRNKVPAVNVKEWKMPERMKGKNDTLLSLSPSLSRSTERFLSREARETIHQVSLVFIISAFTYTAGKVTALFMKGPPAVESPRTFAVDVNLDEDFRPATLNQVRAINIFRTNTGLGKKKQVADAKCEQAQQTSNLPIKLVNTVVLQDQVKSLASVQVRGDRDLQEVRVGDQISNLAKIFKIGRLEMIIRNLESGICESISSDKLRERGTSPISVMTPSQSRAFKAAKKMPGIENVGNKFNISKNLLDEKMKDIASILTQARAIKIQNPDGTMAFKLTEMDPEGLFPYLGLQDQDIITSINGKPIYDMNEVMSLFGKIKNLDKLQLGIRREGSETTLDYNIQK